VQEPDYLVIVQCDLVKQRCSGYFCEKAFHERADGFAPYPADRACRTLYLTCGGCCGKAVQRKLTHLARCLKKHEGVAKDRLVVHLASCITRDNFHSPRCPFADYMKTLISRAGLACREDTHLSPVSERRRAAGLYASPGPPPTGPAPRGNA